MAKSIHERVRAQMEKKARDEKRAEDAKRGGITRRQELKDIRAEERIEGLRNGTVIPRNAREDAIQCDTLDEMYGVDFLGDF